MRILIGGVVVLFAGIGLTSPLGAQQHMEHPEGHAHQHAEAPAEGVRAELIRDVERLEEKYMALAEALSGHYDWRPAEGVRSVGELFGHVANANFMIPAFAGLDREMEDVDFETMDEAGVLEGLEHSFRHVRHSIADVPDDQLHEQVTMFGQEATRREVLLLLATHMHEHLGQAIAYARSNGVTPPWSR